MKDKKHLSIKENFTLQRRIYLENETDGRPSWMDIEQYSSFGGAMNGMHEHAKDYQLSEFKIEKTWITQKK